jgi:hypothetical protein
MPSTRYTLVPAEMADLIKSCTNARAAFDGQVRERPAGHFPHCGGGFQVVWSTRAYSTSQ